MGDVYMAKLAEQERTPALAHSRLPPLLINTKHPHWQAERYEEMVEYMKKVAVASDTDLSLEVAVHPVEPWLGVPDLGTGPGHWACVVTLRPAHAPY